MLVDFLRPHKLRNKYVFVAETGRGGDGERPSSNDEQRRQCVYVYIYYYNIHFIPIYMSSSWVCRRYPPSVYIRSIRSAAVYYITNSHIMSAHKTLSKTERRRRWQRWSTNIYVIILYIGFYTFFLPFIYYYFSCWPSSRPLHARTWKNYYMRNTSRGHTIMILLYYYYAMVLYGDYIHI